MKKRLQPTYIVKNPDEVLFTSSDANEAIEESKTLWADQREHIVEIWIGRLVVGTIELNGKIRDVINQEDSP